METEKSVESSLFGQFSMLPFDYYMERLHLGALFQIGANKTRSPASTLDKDHIFETQVAGHANPSEVTVWMSYYEMNANCR